MISSVCRSEDQFTWIISAHFTFLRVTVARVALLTYVHVLYYRKSVSTYTMHHLSKKRDLKNAFCGTYGRFYIFEIFSIQCSKHGISTDALFSQILSRKTVPLHEGTMYTHAVTQ
jgi:hypothetical protein